jgi:hypothetical protein
MADGRFGCEADMAGPAAGSTRSLVTRSGHLSRRRLPPKIGPTLMSATGLDDVEAEPGPDSDHVSARCDNAASRGLLASDMS